MHIWWRVSSARRRPNKTDFGVRGDVMALQESDIKLGDIPIHIWEGGEG